MSCPSCGQDDMRQIVTDCPDTEEGGQLTFTVCGDCDYGINEHTEGVCTCLDDYDGAPCCPDPGCHGNPCMFPGYADNH